MMRYRTIQRCLSAALFILSAAWQGSGQTSEPPKPADQNATSAPKTTSEAVTPAPSADPPRSLLGQALDLAHKGNYEAAIKKYQELLQEKPKSPDAYAGIVRCYLNRGEVTQANDAVKQALAATDAWPVKVALGEVYFRQGRIFDAEKEWAGVINSGHAAGRAYLGLARMRRSISMYKSAKAMIDKAVELDPTDPEIREMWIETVGRAQQIKYLENYLADKNNSDSDERKDAEHFLAFLIDRSAQPVRPCRLISKGTNTTTPLVRLLSDPTHMRGYALAVELNGVRTNVMLDTGASGITINRRIAQRAGINKIVETKIWGIGDRGKRDAFVGTAETIRIGALEFQDCPVEVLESRSVAGEDGLIGADVFENFLVEINFPDEKLNLSELPKRPGDVAKPLTLKPEEGDAEAEAAGKVEADGAPEKSAHADHPEPQDRYIAPEMQSFTRIFRFGHDLLVPTKIGDVDGKLFILDTGSLNNFISPQAAREVTRVSGDSDTIVKGLSGSVKNVYSANKAVLQFGHLRQENQDMTAIDLSRISQGTGTEVSGFLGFAMLRFLNIRIDYRDGLIDFKYDRKRFLGYSRESR